MPFGQIRDIQLYYEIVGAGPRLIFINGTNADKGATMTLRKGKAEIIITFNRSS